MIHVSMQEEDRQTDPQPTIDSTSLTPIVIAPAGNPTEAVSRRMQAIEVCVFLLLIVPTGVLYFFVPHQGGPNLTLTLIGTALADVGLGSLVVFFAWRNKEPLKLLGLTRRNFWREVGLGAGLFLPFVTGIGYLELGLQRLGFSLTQLSSIYSISANRWQPLLSKGLALIVIAVVEEVVFRGYLIRRLSGVFKSSIVALILSSVIFAFGHSYEGWAGMITVGVDGLIFALVYLWRHSLVSPIVMHFLLDFLAIVLGPLGSTPK